MTASSQPKNLTDTCLDLSGKLLSSFLVVEVSDVAKMTKIKGNIIGGLRDQYHLFPERMGDTGLVKYIGILARTVADDDPGAGDQRDNVLHYLRVFPKVI